MRAITVLNAATVLNPGADNQLQLIDIPIPAFNHSELLIRTKATGVNRADLLQRKGHYPAPPGASPILGLEIAGEVVGVGKSVTQFKVGDRIFGLVNGGGYAEYCVIHEELATKMPDSWSYSFAAAIPESLMTVQGTIFEIGQLQKDHYLLIHGAGSGIGSLAIQMAVLSGAHVITTVGREDKIEKAYALGAEQVINYREADFRTCLAKNSLNLILDFIGGDYFNKHLELLIPQGKLIQIASMKGANVECNLALIMRKRLQINGFVLRLQNLSEKAALWKAANHRWFSDLCSGKLTPLIDAEFSLADVEKAHLRMQAGEHFGKIVILF